MPPLSYSTEVIRRHRSRFAGGIEGTERVEKPVCEPSRRVGRLSHGSSASGPGAEVAHRTDQSISLVALTAQFQGYCVGLHDQATEEFVNVTPADLKGLVQRLLGQGRKMDTGNARTDSLGADYGRFGFKLIDALKLKGQNTEKRLKKLDG